jgi:hypothetical protein
MVLTNWLSFIFQTLQKHLPPGCWACSLNLQGYARIEAHIIGKVISGQLSPAAAIPQLEAEMDE